MADRLVRITLVEPYEYIEREIKVKVRRWVWCL